MPIPDCRLEEGGCCTVCTVVSFVYDLWLSTSDFSKSPLARHLLKLYERNVGTGWGQSETEHKEALFATGEI
jgi:hypothetical protein